MVQSLQLGTPNAGGNQGGMRRLNRLPIFAAIAFIILFTGVVVIGLSWRGLSFDRGGDVSSASSSPATTFGDQLKQGIGNGIIGDPDQQAVFQPAPTSVRNGDADHRQLKDQPALAPPEQRAPITETDADWKARLKREQDEAYLREQNRQKMARLQARATALDSPLKVDVSSVASKTVSPGPATQAGVPTVAGAGSDLYSDALNAGLAGQNADPNGQTAKEDFFNQDIKDLGYLQSKVVQTLSQDELKRGSVISATLITGLNSDLPGRITAQVSQNVYDSATGYRLLIPQGAKLFGRYDSKVSFGQERALVVWTDLIFPDGATLQIGGMAGTDSEGYGGFSDEVNRHLWRTFGSAALVALIGSGIDMSIPQSSTLATQDTASDAARRNFAQVFGQAAEQTISKNLNVQPTIQIRPGYKFNVLVDQDVIFPGVYHG